MLNITNQKFNTRQNLRAHFCPTGRFLIASISGHIIRSMATLVTFLRNPLTIKTQRKVNANCALWIAWKCAQKQNHRSKWTCVLFFDLKPGIYNYSSSDYLLLRRNGFTLKYQPIHTFYEDFFDITTFDNIIIGGSNKPISKEKGWEIIQLLQIIKNIPACHTLFAFTTAPIATSNQFWYVRSMLFDSITVSECWINNSLK